MGQKAFTRQSNGRKLGAYMKAVFRCRVWLVSLGYLTRQCGIMRGLSTGGTVEGWAAGP
jgi:hypothetical protein